MSLTSNTTPLKWVTPKGQATMKSRNATQNRSAIKVNTTNVDLYKTTPNTDFINPGFFQSHEYCLLYEYLHRNPYKQAFSNFRDTIGSDVFTEEQFRSLFNQFRTRKIKGFTGSITNLRDVLCDDKIALRACIIYETLRCKMVTRGYSTSYLWPRSTLKRHEILRNPSFPLYKNFCEKLGNDAMEYREFDYWFYRFFNGDFNLSCEKEKDEKKYELTDMPMDIMKRIVGNLDIFDRISLAQTSRSLKTFVEDQKVFNQKVGLYIDDSSARISLNNYSLYITESGSGCRRCTDRPGSDKLIQGVSYWKQGIQELKRILNCSELYLEEFHLVLFERRFELGMIYTLLTSEELNGVRFKIFEEVIDVLEVALKSIRQLHAKKLWFRAHSMKSLPNILLCLKPGYLSTIDLDASADSCHFEQMEKLEQWKLAKCFRMTHASYVAPLFHLYHFKEFHVEYYNILRAEDVCQMKEILFKSPCFEHCKIELNVPLMNDIGNEFGDAIEEDPDTYHYHIPNSEEFFEIELNVWNIVITRKNK